MKFSHWSNECIGLWANNNLPSYITKFTNDSRKTEKGDCFVAIKTKNRDGHNFVNTAAENGATCALVESAQNNVRIPQFVVKNTQEALNKIAISARKNFTGTTIGITGSFGKTTTKDLLKLLTNTKNNTTLANENGQIGLAFTIAKLKNDEKFAIIEIGIDKPCSMENLLNICKPNIGIITGIGLAHCASFGNIDVTAKEKFRLAELIIQQNSKCFISEQCLKFNVFKQNQSYLNTVSPKIITQSNGQRLLQIEDHKIEVPFFMSTGVVKNLALAVECAKYLGIPDGQIEHNLKLWQPSKLRGEIISNVSQTFFADCYNANDVSFFDSIENFNRIFEKQQKLFVIGTLKEEELGESHKIFNEQIGHCLILKKEDMTILIGKESSIISMYLTDHGFNPKQIHCVNDKSEASNIIKTFNGAIFLKGHRSYALETLIL